MWNKIAVLVISFIFSLHNSSWVRQHRPVDLINLAGTGSMYPTIPKGVGDKKEWFNQTVGSLPMNRFIATPSAILGFFAVSDIKRQDIIRFRNQMTEEITTQMYGSPSGMIKRVIGLPGETIEIRGGQVYINDQVLTESYTATSSATFGQYFLAECQKFTIPPNHVFVMGDNRKGSGDSREFGPINLVDIYHVLPVFSQTGHYDKNYRDTTNDLQESSRPTLDKNKYLALLNQIRKEAGVPALKYNLKLEKSAAIRGEAMLKFDDFSYTATRSGVTQTQALTRAGYSNIVWGETWAVGSFDHDELIDYDQEFPKSKKFLMDSRFQEIGISEVRGNLRGCPTQILVRDFGGYVPPNYTKEYISSWQAGLDQLRSVATSWKTLSGTDGDTINSLISERIRLLENIVSTMRANRWVQESQYSQDKTLTDKINSLADKLNHR